MSKFTVTLDPGLRCAGVAIFKGKYLEAVEAVTTDGGMRDGHAWIEMAKVVETFIKSTIDDEPYDLVYEQMVFLPAWAKKKGSGQRLVDDLLQLAGVTGAVCMLPGVELIRAYTPIKWKPKGETKVKTQARIKRTIGLKESAAIQKMILTTKQDLIHNAYDAVGIGLYHFFRAPKRG